MAHAFVPSTWEAEGTLWASLAPYAVRACLKQQNPKIPLYFGVSVCASWVRVSSEARTRVPRIGKCPTWVLGTEPAS